MMVSYEEAKAKAMKINPNINTAREYRGAYVFYNSKSKGDDNEVTILKSSGNYVSFSDYAVSAHDESLPKKLKF